MANFAKGFVQGFTPHVSNVSDIISNVLIRQYNKSLDVKARDNDRLIKEQEAQKMAEQDKLLYEEYVKDPVKNSMLLGSMSPDMRVAANNWTSKQDKYKVDERTDEKGKHLIKQRIDWQGNILDEQVMETIPTEVRTETVEQDGVTQTWKIMSDGSRVQGNKKVDLTQRKKQAEDLKKKEDNEILTFRKEIIEANKSFAKANIYKTQAEVKASNFKEPKTPDYSDSQLSQLDYSNKKTILKFKARQTMSPTAFEALDQIDQWNDPTVYKDEVKQLIMDLRKEGASQTDVSKIAQWYLLKTGKELE